MLGIPTLPVPLLSSNCLYSIWPHKLPWSRNFCTFLFASIFHVKTGKYFMGFWHSWLIGNANLFWETVKFKACMFLLSITASQHRFPAFCAVWLRNTQAASFLPPPHPLPWDKKKILSSFFQLLLIWNQLNASYCLSGRPYFFLCYQLYVSLQLPYCREEVSLSANAAVVYKVTCQCFKHFIGKTSWDFLNRMTCVF